MKKAIVVFALCVLTTLSFANERDVERNQQKWQEIFTQFQESKAGILTPEQKLEVAENLKNFLKDPQNASLHESSAALLSYYLMNIGALGALWPENDSVLEKYKCVVEGLVPQGQEVLTLRKINEQLGPLDTKLRSRVSPSDGLVPRLNGVKEGLSISFDDVLKIMSIPFQEEQERKEKALSRALQVRLRTIRPPAETEQTMAYVGDSSKPPKPPESSDSYKPPKPPEPSDSSKPPEQSDLYKPPKPPESSDLYKPPKPERYGP